MRGFISSLISRHLESGKNVMPRLRGRFEPPDISANNSLTDYTESGENIVEQKPGQNTGPEGRRDIFKSRQNSPGEMNISSETSHPGLSKNKHKDEDPADQGIKYNPPATLENPTAPGIMPANPHTGLHQFNGSGHEENKKSTPLRENHVINTNNPAEKTPEFTSNVLPVSSDEIKPFTDSREFKPTADRPGGTLGEPPGAISPKNRSDHTGLEADLSEKMANPVIKVSIGQINVRAVSPPPSVVAQKPREAAKQLLSLEDYLKQRGKR